MTGYDENAQPESLPGYAPSSALPGTSGSEPDSDTGPSDADTFTTEPDGPQYRSALSDTAAMPGNMMTALQASVAAADAQAQQEAHTQPSAPTGFSPLAGGGHPGQLPEPGTPPPVNTVHAQHMSGYVAASLAWADDSLVTALQAAAAAGGPHAALMAPTVHVDTLHGTVRAGGAIPVGRHSTPASALVHGSQGGQAQFARNAPWFFPAVQAWAIANPPPTLGPQDGTLPMAGR